MSNLDYLLN